MIKKFLITVLLSISTVTFIGCNAVDSYHNALDTFEDTNDDIQEKDVTGKFLRKSLEKNDEVNKAMNVETETSTVTNDKESKEDNKTNFLGR